MTNRSIYRENAQRKGIYREALNLIEQGWHVMANHIPGYHPPPELEGFIPDIYAIKSTDTFIVEIITVAGLDSEKHIALKKYAKQFKGMRFMCWMVDMAGRRMMHIR